MGSILARGPKILQASGSSHKGVRHGLSARTFLWAGSQRAMMLSPCYLAACQRTGQPPPSHPPLQLPHPLPEAFPSRNLLPWKDRKIQWNSQVHLTDSHRRGPGVLPGASTLILVCIQLIYSAQGPDTAEIPWLAFMHEFWKQSYIAVLELLRCLRTVFLLKYPEEWRHSLMPASQAFRILQWALNRLTVYCV